MIVQFASDLHLEFADNWRYLKEHPLEKTGDILVLAGDIGYLGDDNYSSHPFWDIVADQYEQILVVPGNHEFYKYYDISTLTDGELLQIRPNVRVYTQKAVLMMIADKLPDLVKTQVEAVKGINIDKVTVWDGVSEMNGVEGPAK